MPRFYQLWDTGTGNLMDEFASEGEALAFIREVVIAEGARVVDDWALGWGDEDGDGAAIAHGNQLADLACGRVNIPPPALAG